MARVLPKWVSALFWDYLENNNNKGGICVPFFLWGAYVMGFCLFSFGYGMRFSRGAWLKWIVIFSFIFNVVLSYKANANPLLARVVLAEVFEGIVARRAAVSVVGRAAGK